MPVAAAAPAFAPGDKAQVPGLPRARRATYDAMAFQPTPDQASTRSPGPAHATEAASGASASAPPDAGADPAGDNGRMPLPSSLTLRGPSGGSVTVDTPVVLAPMAGITNAAYRRLCAEQGAGLYVCEMITSAGSSRGTRRPARCWSSTSWRRSASVQLYGTDPVYVGQAVRDPVRRPRRRARRPQLRLPGAQGDPQGRRRSAAVEARPARRDPRRGGRGRGAVRRPGHDEDAQGPRRRPPHLPRRRSHRPGVRRGRDRPARAHRRAGLLRRGRLGRHRRAGRPASTSRCSATGTSGRRPTPCAWSRRPVSTASSSAGAAWAVRGSSATWPRPSPASRSRRCPPSAR